MTNVNQKSAKAVLSICHVACMLDLVALPVWVGALIQFYRLTPIEAGATVTAFLVCIVIASAILAPLFARLPHRLGVVIGFAISALVFIYLASVPIAQMSFAKLAAAHAIAGLATGSALSITHGAIGRTNNPHNLFGWANTLVGIFGIFFFALVPTLIQNVGAQVLFQVFAGAMIIGAISAAAAFPRVEAEKAEEQEKKRMLPPMPAKTWLVIFVVICLVFNQALYFSFAERLGAAKGFAPESIAIVLLVLGIMNLFPGAIAALTQRLLSSVVIGMVGPIGQAVLAMVAVHASTLLVYAVPTILYPGLVIFTHTFLFGLLAQVDKSGRAVAATPAMMMIGAAAGPAVGGAVVTAFGFAGLGYTVTLVSAVAVILMFIFKTRSAAVAQPAE